MTARVLPCGDTALLLEVEDLPAVLALADAVRAARLPGVVDVVPAARTVLVTTEPGGDLGRLRRGLVEVAATAHGDRSPDAGPVEHAEGDVIEIPVVYDGPDLPGLCSVTGLDADGLVGAHTGTPWRVAFFGFAPGFAYLAGGDPRLAVPRRSEPRTRVPSGSVALAAGYSGIYPRQSSGGWQLIGRTGVVLWDIEHDPPALLRPGGWVRFVDAGRGR